MRNAVEASPSRAKALGASSNLYIVEGDVFAYVHGSKGVDEGFLISTRSVDYPTRVGYLSVSEFRIDTLWPRPNVSLGWVQSEDGLWYKSDSGVRGT